jgi:presenilin-like A22 family membrane protease
LLALIISFWRLYKPNAIVHNISEIFVYGGLAAFMVNIFNLFAAFMLLILVSIYDYIAVYRTRHMVKLAEFQSKSRVFAGLFIPYQREKLAIKASLRHASAKQKPKGSVAVLGGGDIGFTLIFAGVVMKGLMLHESVLFGFLKTLIIPVFSTLALLFLLVKGQQDKFYPAMPVLSLGCFIGYLIVWLV